MFSVASHTNLRLEPIDLTDPNTGLPFDSAPYKRVSAAVTDNGTRVMYVCTGYTEADGRTPREVHVFYANGSMWYSFGRTIEQAVRGAFADIWKQCLIVR